MKRSETSRVVAEKLKAINSSTADETTKQLARQKVYEEQGVVFGDVKGNGSDKGFTGIRGVKDESGTIHFSKYKNGQRYGEGSSYRHDSSASIQTITTAHESILNWAGGDLSTNNGLMALSQQMYNVRSNYYSDARINHRIQRSYDAGVARGMHNYSAGKTNRVTNITDLSDSATRMAFARNEGMKTTRELQAVSLQLVGGIATLPSLVTGVGALGNLALRGMVNLVPKVGHGLMTLGRASVNLADDMVLHAGTYARSAIWRANPLSLAQTEITKVALRQVAFQAGQNARVGLTGAAGSLNTQLGNLAANKAFQSVIQQGGVNGATNLAADLAFNGVDGANPFKSFTTGFIGGAMFGGVRNPIVAGMGASLTTEFLDQRWEKSMGREEMNYDDLILATVAGGAAGFGLNKYFSSSNWVPKNFGAFADEGLDSFIGNYGNNVFSNW